MRVCVCVFVCVGGPCFELFGKVLIMAFDMQMNRFNRPPTVDQKPA